jgi:hypothetical protein
MPSKNLSLPALPGDFLFSAREAGGLEGCKPSKNHSFWWYLAAKPANTTRK